MNYQAILFALATFATQAASASIIARNDLLHKPLMLSIFAKCTTEDCHGDPSGAVFTKTVGTNMVATNMMDYWENGKGDGLGPEYTGPVGYSGTRKIGEIIFESTTGGEEDPGQEFWVDDSSKDGMHISCHAKLTADPGITVFGFVASAGEEGQGSFSVKCVDAPLAPI